MLSRGVFDIKRNHRRIQCNKFNWPVTSEDHMLSKPISAESTKGTSEYKSLLINFGLNQRKPWPAVWGGLDPFTNDVIRGKTLWKHSHFMTYRRYTTNF